MSLRPFLFALLLFFSSTPEAVAQSRRAKKPVDGFALVEFFTTENCLSCREGSEVARAVDENYRASKDKVFLLSFHIDYLTSPNWKDPYSKSEFSQRQKEYSAALGQTHLVPAAMVINGSHYVKGSNAVWVQRTVLAEVKKRPRAKFTTEQSWREPGKAAKINYEVKGLSHIRKPYFWLHTVVAERKIVRPITDGDNAGYTYTHTNVVRHFETQRMQPQGKGDVDVIIPKGITQANGSIVLYVQDPQNMKVLGATRIDLEDI